MPNQNQKTYKIGTRGSLLALTQCNQIKDLLEEVTGDKFELEVIKTQGDMDTSKPLWQMEGKDFFTKELDEALLTGKVDLVVHSYKDLGSERPDGIQLAAVTKRSYAHDILLFRKDVIKDLHNRSEIIVGTSSPRRIVNVEKNLADFLPQYDNEVSIKTKVLRGNVNTRIEKLKNGEYDAIVLALPGIERLAITESSRNELTPLLEGLNFMILPQTIFPSAASQGALGIECFSKRDDNEELLKKLKLVEDKVTVQEVSRERSSFNSYGGGCHLAVGINVRKVGENYVHIHQGTVDNKVIDEILLESVSETCSDKSSIFIGLPSEKISSEVKDIEILCDEYVEKTKLDNTYNKVNADVLVSSPYCIHAVENTYKEDMGLWTAGTRTWKKLAQKGHWVHGCADSMGEQEIDSLRKSKTVEILLSSNREIKVLTNDQSKSDLGETIPCYTRELKDIDQKYKDSLKNTNVFYWTSFYQYEEFLKLCPEVKDKYHCCGLGKTHKQFQDKGIRVRPFSTMKEFKNWIKE